jgi:hypothetical protein
MKLKKILILCAMVAAVLLVVVLGFVKRHSENTDSSPDDADNVSVITESDDADPESTIEPEEEYVDRVRKENEQVEENGNFYQQGEYVSYGGIGYQVSSFTIYNSYEELVSEAPGYDTAYEYIPVFDERFDRADSCFAYVEVQITNELGTDKSVDVIGIDLYATAADNRTVTWQVDDKTYGAAFRKFYIGGDSIPDEEDKLNPVVAPGETITIYMAFLCDGMIEYGEGDDYSYEYVDLEEILPAPDWYIGIPGTSSWGGSCLTNLEELKTYIFFKCTAE